MVSSPKPPSAGELGGAQFGANKDTALFNTLLNTINTSTPFGSDVFKPGKPVTFKDSTGKPVTVPQFERKISLDPRQQKIFDIQNRAGIENADTALTLSKSLTGKPVSATGIQGWQKAAEAPTLDRARIGAPDLATSFADSGEITKSYGANDFSADRRRVEDALMARYAEDFAKNESGLDQKLRNQGLVPGSEAYNTQFDQLNRMKNDATFQSILAGGQEQSRLTGLERDKANFQNSAQGQQFGQDQARGLFANQFGQGNFDNKLTSQDQYNRNLGMQFGYDQSESNEKNALRQNQLNERLGLRNQTINEIAALKGGTQVSSPPQVQSHYQSSVNPVPVAELMQQQYQNEAQRAEDRRKGLFGLLGLLPF